MNRKMILTYGLVVLGLGLAAYLLWNIFSQYTWSDIVASVAEIPTANLLAAIAFSAGSYLCLTGFDWMGIRYVRKDLAYPRIVLASFITQSIGQSVGLAGLSSGALRYRYYAHWGLNTEHVAKIVLLSGVTVSIGLTVLTGIVMILNPADAAQVFRLNEATALGIGILCLLLTAGYLALAKFARAPVRIRKWTFQMPTLRLALAQVVIGTTNFALVAAALREVMGATADVSYLKAATAYVLGNVAIIVTHVPGGLGVLEATVRHVMGDQASIGSLVAFRVIYFFIPLAIGIPLALITEAVFRARKASSPSPSSVTEPGSAT
ncbi:lysylphosphatidylglycerol synthase domain-containing protein [Neorhizobium sp. T786]|uniref:lysylphosphatidylglycerol synthase domain-containing protein n=1 Tax=Pseudorhizobium xiangyangii TaxID=2883104 RepID=UPI001CFF7AB5|nr:lysylphosphatidylglycerol synthase domain-containing protein [Neorhizobium xiangyangii]MCB5203403.1 lysylphosphatidylglycerol synthase domain-containing protein [Neorhizobium xiangyangii]